MQWALAFLGLLYVAIIVLLLAGCSLPKTGTNWESMFDQATLNTSETGELTLARRVEK